MQKQYKIGQYIFNLEDFLTDQGWSESDIKEAYEDQSVQVLNTRELYEYIAEITQIDSYPEIIQRYFDYDGIIRSMEHNGELIELDYYSETHWVLV